MKRRALSEGGWKVSGETLRPSPLHWVLYLLLLGQRALVQVELGLKVNDIHDFYRGLFTSPPLVDTVKCDILKFLCQPN